jgi:hypothetical protein
MIRQIATEFGIFLLPFAVYALFLILTRNGVLHPSAWPLHLIAKLAVVSLMLVIISLVLLAELSGGGPNSTYIPAHVENGKLVPGVLRHD